MSDATSPSPEGATSNENAEQRRKIHEEWETSFGDKVRQWRRARSWSQEDISSRLRDHGFDMHQTTVAKIERGARPLRIAEASALCSIFCVPPLAFFMGPGPEDQPESLQDLQRQMNGAAEALETAKKVLDNTGALYASTYANMQRIARKLNDAAAQQEIERQNDSEA